MRLVFAAWVAAHRGEVGEARTLLTRLRTMCDAVGDRYAESRAEEYAVGVVSQSIPTTQPPVVDIKGFPFLTQLMGATICVAWAFGATYVVFALVNKVKSMRVAPEVELEGLDIPEFGLKGYPEDATVTMEA